MQLHTISIYGHSNACIAPLKAKKNEEKLKFEKQKLKHLKSLARDPDKCNTLLKTLFVHSRTKESLD